MDRHSYKIYCAGPLFNPKEREEMANIASALKEAGYLFFLPQEDGLEFARLLPYLTEKGISVSAATHMLNMAIFSIDVFEIKNSQGIILNVNGRVPDEGAMVEAGIAWSLGKSVVIFKNDDRSLVEGCCNPLVMGLSNFEFVQSYDDIPEAFDGKFTNFKGDLSTQLDFSFETVSAKGKTISDYLLARKTLDQISNLLVDIFGEISCPDSKAYTQNV